MSERITISIPADLKSKLDEVALKTDLPVSDIVRRCVSNALPGLEKKFSQEVTA